MLMVIFGAGASFDSAQAWPTNTLSNVQNERGLAWRPPLANDLFLDPHGQFSGLVTRYRQMIPILPILRGRRDISVEEVLESLQAEGNEYVERQRQLMAVRFYLRDLLHGCSTQWLHHTDSITNYTAIVDQILRWHKSDNRICLVTFNYDLLLEWSLPHFGFPNKEPADFINANSCSKNLQIAWVCQLVKNCRVTGGWGHSSCNPVRR